MSNSTISSSSKLEQFVQRGRRLYTLPAVAMKVIELTNNPKVDVAELKKCIENDPALTSKILRTVNSSLFGLSGKVSDLNQALALLGIKPLKLLVLGFSLPTELFADIENDVLENYWRHALTKAVAGRELCEKFWKTAGDEAFIAGLLQDLGILALLQDLGQPYATFLKKIQLESGDLSSLEIATLGFDHTVLSARMLKNWGLPESLAISVALPRDLDRLESLPKDQSVVPKILHLAELLAQLLADQRSEILPEILQVGSRYCGLSEKEIEPIVSTIQEKVAQLAEVLSLKLPPGKDYTELLLQAHSQLATVAAEAAGDLICLEEGQVWEEAKSLVDAVRNFSADTPAPTKTVAYSSVGGSPESLANNSFGKAAGLAATAQVACSNTDPGLIGRVSASVTTCRQKRSPLSLLLIELDDFMDLVVIQGLPNTQQIVQLLETVVANLNPTEDSCLHLGDAQFALVLPDCERSHAVEEADRLVRGLRQWSRQRVDEGAPAISVSVGVATVSMPPKNFPALDLIEAAQRCLYAAQNSGGNGPKSINIY